jgi:hypothetical protein
MTIVATAGFGVVLAGVVSAVGVLIFGSLLEDEVRGWWPRITRAIVRAAALMVPRAVRDRHREDWLTDVAEFEDRPISALVWALGCCVAAVAEWRELPRDPGLGAFGQAEALSARVFLYGARNQGMLVGFAIDLRARAKSLSVVGGWSPPYWPMTDEELEVVAAEIAAARPDVVWVGLGVPVPAALRLMEALSGRVGGCPLVMIPRPVGEWTFRGRAAARVRRAMRRLRRR